MSAENTFRFTLSFPRKTADQIRVGELLARMGNKKSRFIVLAVNEYIGAHPELSEQSGSIHIQESKSGFSREELRVIITEILTERGYITSDSFERPQESSSRPVVAGVDDMLDNLNVFFK